MNPERASNVRENDYPEEFTRQTFLDLYPQFAICPVNVLDMYVEQAKHCIQRCRWHALWMNGITLYIAHWLTLWLRANAPAGSSMAQVAEAGMSKGAISSKSVDGVSVSYGSTNAQGDLQGWGSYRDTLFGEQFATLARIVGKGGVYVI